MRFDSITIPAFGHFKDFSLKFPKTGNDLHLIYGPNEAGKSSLLRAIDNLFFGIPIRTPDNFLHENKNLRIGATISQGTETLSFLRKNGRNNSLLDSNQNTLADSALAPFLGSVNEDFFQQMFGLDTESLRAGAAKLLAGEGDLGTAIFSASLGGSPIDAAIRNLEAEADLLFKGRATSTTIAKALKALKDAETEAKKEIISTNAWTTLKTGIKNAQSLFDEKNRLHRAHQNRWQFVDSSLRALPVLAMIHRLEAEITEIEAPELPSDFPRRVRALQADLAQSAQAHELQKQQIERLESELKAIGDFTPILAATADFETLQRKAEQHLDNLAELPRLEARLTGTDLKKLPVVSATEQAVLNESAESLSECTHQIIEISKSLKNLGIELTSRQNELTNATDLSSLEDQCQQADELAAELATLPNLERNLITLNHEIETLTARLETTGDPSSLKIPGAKTIQAAIQEHERLTTSIREVESRLTDLRDSLAEEEASLKHLATQASLFTIADLVSSRDERDALWAEILKSRKINPKLTGAIAHSDEVTDALRDHADHIATAAGHQAKISQLKAKKNNLESDFEKSREALEKWMTEWQKQSDGKLPLELSEWREEWEKLCDLTKKAEPLAADISRLQDQRTTFLGEHQGDDFTKVHRKLKSALSKAHQDEGQRKTILKQVTKDEIKRDQLTQQLASLNAQRATAESAFQQACATASIPDNLPPAAAVEALKDRAQARERLLEFQNRSSASKAYQTLLEATAKRFKIEASESALTALHHQAKIDEHQARALQEQLSELQESFPKLKLTHQGHQNALTALCEQANTHDLDPVIVLFEARAELTTRLAEQKTALQSFAGTRPLPEFIADLEEQDLAALEEEKATLEETDSRCQSERDNAKTSLDDYLRHQEELMKASDLAAARKQAAADAFATVVADSERFRQLHYALDFLKQQVEFYRKKTQDPMIARTSAFFKTLTSGSFESVAAQLDEKGRPQLISIRQGGETVPTTGLSEGTADQLYLALRLAAIDLHLENHQAIPLILDDLLMTFDDERTKALLPVLTELAKKTQVLIFTHHSHLKELIGKKVSVHELE